jgi:hypothetical protein
MAYCLTDYLGFTLCGHVRGKKTVPQKSTYWVRSKQANETSDFGRRPVPARFKTREEADLYRRELNLRRGAYHPGYYVEEQDDSPPAFSAGIGNS